MADNDPDPLADDRVLRALVAGRRLLGRYTLEIELGRGGMGVVWRARDEVLDEIVALKFLPESVARDPVALDDLKHETRRAHRLTHPHIVRVHDFTQHGELAAVSMEFVDGSNLTQFLRQRTGRVFTVGELAPLVAQLCDALHYAHRTARIVHRDLKPANLLLTVNGELKVTDFGISRSLTETRTRHTLGATQGASGTLPYMSPQQLHGEKPLVTDDIYALGATLYELLAGKPPFHRGDMLSLMVQIKEKAPLPIDAQRAELNLSAEPVPRVWEEAILACLAKDAHSRPQTAREVADRLGLNGEAAYQAAIAKSTPVKTNSVSLVAEPTPQPGDAPQDAAPRRKLPHLLVGAIAALVLAAAAVVAWRLTHVGTTQTAGSPKPPITAVSATTTRAESAASAETKAAVSPAVLREFTVTFVPAEADVRLWLGPFSDYAAKGGRLVLNDLPDGPHDMAVQAAGYEPFTEKVTVKDGRGHAEVNLVPIKGGLEITGRPGTIATAINARGETTPLGTVGPGGVLAVTKLLPVGAYVVRLENVDCETLEVKGVDVGIGRVNKMSPPQVPLPGELTVTSATPDAEVRINGSVAGRTPRVVSPVPSERAVRVEVSRMGFRRAEQDVKLAAQEKRPLDVGALVPEAGGIAVRSEEATFPIAAVTAKVDGKPVTLKHVGDAWLVEDQPAGARTLELTHPDYEPWRQSVDVRDRQNSAVTAAFVPKPAVVKLAVTGPRSYTVFINRKPTPVVDGRVTVPAQEPVGFEVRAKGYRPVAGRITLPPNTEKTLPVTMETQAAPKPGRPHENSLQMKFLPVPGVNALVSIWETRVSEFELFLFSTNQKGRHLLGESPANEPAIGMTWDEAASFCQWLTETERAEGGLAPNQKYRLPTDAEWSLAVGLGREVGKTPAEKNLKIRDVYPWGKQWPPPARTGNFAGEELEGSVPRLAGYSDGFAKLAPVGSFPPNRHGLYDVTGNVWEWCEDEIQPGTGLRVVRGGSFLDYDALALLSAARGRHAHGEFSPNIGFRCVLETETK